MCIRDSIQITPATAEQLWNDLGACHNKWGVFYVCCGTAEKLCTLSHYLISSCYAHTHVHVILRCLFCGKKWNSYLIFVYFVFVYSLLWWWGLPPQCVPMLSRGLSLSSIPSSIARTTDPSSPFTTQSSNLTPLEPKLREWHHYYVLL